MDPKGFQNHTLDHRSALGPSKNELRKGGWKRRENFSEIQSSLVAKNDVWRYTLCLFHIFAFFEDILKINAKWVPKVDIFDPKTDLWRPSVS